MTTGIDVIKRVCQKISDEKIDEDETKRIERDLKPLGKA